MGLFSLFKTSQDSGGKAPTLLTLDRHNSATSSTSAASSRKSYGATDVSGNAQAVGAAGDARKSRRRSKRRTASRYFNTPPSYRHMLIKYTLTVPLSSILLLVLLITLKVTVWPHALRPSPVKEVLTAAAAWTVGFALRTPIFALSTGLQRYINGWTIALSTFLQVAAQEILRLSVLVLLNIRLTPDKDGDTIADTYDPAFTRVWWIAIGWGVADVVVGIAQGYEQLGLYKDVLPPYTPTPVPPHSRTATGGISRRMSDVRAGKQPQHISNSLTEDSGQVQRSPPPTQPTSPTVQQRRLSYTAPAPAVPNRTFDDLESHLSHLLTIKSRAEIEDVYGTPLPSIPIFLISLQRLDSILLSVGFTLLISSAYLVSEWAGGVGMQRLWITLLGVVLVHFGLAALWTEALPKIGVHSASYIGLLVALGVVFAGLGSWGALI